MVVVVLVVVVDVDVVLVEEVLDDVVLVVDVVVSGPSPTDDVPHAVSNARNPSATARRTNIPPRLHPATTEWWQSRNYSPATISAMSSPASVGFWPTFTPASSSASILAAAVPLPPETMAPAWPIFFPGGAVTPAM